LGTKIARLARIAETENFKEYPLNNSFNSEPPNGKRFYSDNWQW